MGRQKTFKKLRKLAREKGLENKTQIEIATLRTEWTHPSEGVVSRDEKVKRAVNPFKRWIRQTIKLNNK